MFTSLAQCAKVSLLFSVWGMMRRGKSLSNTERAAENSFNVGCTFAYSMLCISLFFPCSVWPVGLTGGRAAFFIRLRGGEKLKCQSVNKNVFPSEPVGLFSFSLCFFGENNCCFAFVFWWNLTREEGGKGQAMCSPSLSLKQEKSQEGCLSPLDHLKILS